MDGTWALASCANFTGANIFNPPLYSKLERCKLGSRMRWSGTKLYHFDKLFSIWEPLSSLDPSDPNFKCPKHTYRSSCTPLSQVIATEKWRFQYGIVFVFVFLSWDLTLKPRLAWNSLYSLGWSQAQGNPPIFSSMRL